MFYRLLTGAAADRLYPGLRETESWEWPAGLIGKARLINTNKIYYILKLFNLYFTNCFTLAISTFYSIFSK